MGKWLDFQITKNFWAGELACKDGTLKLDMHAVTKLQELRDRLGVPLHITSAFRTPDYNRKCGGSPNSQHLQAKAFDITMTTKLRKIGYDKIKEIALELGFTGIGFYKTFIHVDVRANPHPRGYSFWDHR